MKITQSDVDYVAALANLQLSSAERERMEKDLNSILDYIEMLSEVDTSNVEPMAQVESISANGNLADPLRDDQPRPSLAREVALKNAPQTDGSFFRVPKVIER
jgi:aspartyl-tRNA(Asn)/glutamyl-tRNA(Gln) amidotransferase subunit C